MDAGKLLHWPQCKNSPLAVMIEHHGDPPMNFRSMQRIAVIPRHLSCRAAGLLTCPVHAPSRLAAVTSCMDGGLSADRSETGTVRTGSRLTATGIVPDSHRIPF